VDGGIRYGELCGPLDRRPRCATSRRSHISVAGACATGTHGPASPTRPVGGGHALQLVRRRRRAGDDRRSGRGRTDLPLAGSVVALGALGVVARLTLEVEPAFRMRQDVFLDLDGTAFRTGSTRSSPWATASAASRPDRPRSTRSGSSGGCATATRRPGAARRRDPGDPAGAPIPGASPGACTAQLGRSPWHERLPHSGWTTPSGDELQSEYFVRGRRRRPSTRSTACATDRAARPGVGDPHGRRGWAGSAPPTSGRQDVPLHLAAGLAGRAHPAPGDRGGVAPFGPARTGAKCRRWRRTSSVALPAPARRDRPRPAADPTARSATSS
jgi:xylitol oxidase